MLAVYDGQFFMEHILFLNMYKFVLYFRHSIEFLNVTQLFDMRVVRSSRVGDAISSTFLNHINLNLLRYFYTQGETVKDEDTGPQNPDKGG